ncbi:MAG: metal ABC transporter substrate-binding protein [Dehalococcoidia bacterium]
MRSSFVRFALLVPLGAALLGASACGASDDGGDGGGADGADGDALRIVTTTPLLAEFAAGVAGEEARVEALIPRGVDLHSWQPSTAVARTVTEADVLIVNGYNLEESLLDIVFENAPEGSTVVVAAAGLEALEGGHDHAGEEHADDEHAEKEQADDIARAEGDPHLWLSVPNAIHYVENIRDALVAIDAGHAEGYRERADALIGELEALDAEVRAELDVIPAERRTIVVFHDAYQYLAHEYGLEVSAAVAPANPNQETSAQAIAAIVERVRELGVTAVYREPQFSAQSLELIAQETGAEVLVLHSTLSDDMPTYAAMMRANATSLSDGLDGEPGG